MVTDPSASVDFPGREQSEVVQFYFRQHWIRLVPELFKMIAWSVAIAFGYALTAQIDAEGQTTTRHVMAALLSIVLLYAHFNFLNAFYRHFLYVFIISDRKAHRIKKSLFLIDEHQSIDMQALQDINKSQRGVMQNMFRFGTLILEAQESVLRIHFVPDIQEKYNAILRLRGTLAASQADGSYYAPPVTSVIND